MAPTPGSARTLPRPRKNLLWIVVDGARTEKTIVSLPLATRETRRSAHLPFLDGLRELGTTWSEYCAVSSSATPNFATMFTGLAPGEHGVAENRSRVLRDVPTLAEILRERGWYTYAEVTGPLVPETGLDRGFDHWRWRDPSETLPSGLEERLAALLPTLLEPWFLCVHLRDVAALPSRAPELDDPALGTTPHDRALSLVDLALGRVFGGVDLETTTIVYAGNHGQRLAADWELHRALGGDDAEVLLAQYDFERSGAAAAPGAWFRHLRDELGEAAARIHGHGILGHGFHLTEDLVRVSLVIVDEDRCLPGDAHRGVRSQLALFSTTLDLLAVDLDGLAREPSLLDAAEPEFVYLEASGNAARPAPRRCRLRGARGREWKYWRLEGGDLRVLWNLRDDPRETRNVASAHPDVVARMDRFVDEVAGRPPAGAPVAPTRSEEAVLESTMRSLGYL